MASSQAPNDAWNMNTLSWLRLGLAWGTATALGAAACGSEDGSKKARCTDNDRCSSGGAAGEGGNAGSAAGEGATAGSVGARAGAGGSAAGEAAGGETTSRAGAEATGAAGQGGTDSSGGAASSGGAGGASTAIACATGTADCDDDPSDCETNTASDAQNCGRCERTCGATAACTNGLCAATVLLNPTVSSNWCGATFSATTAYMVTCWGDNNLSEVRTTPLEPGADITGTRIRHYTNVSVVAMRGILIDGGNVFYGLEGSPSNLWQFPLDANDTTDVTLGLTLENGMRFDDLQLVGDTYYWTDNDHTSAGVVSGASLYKRSKTDNASTPLVTGLGLAYNLQVTPTKLVFFEIRSQGGALHVYRAPLAGAAVGALEDVATAGAGSYLVKQGDYVYWTSKLAKPNGKLQRLKYADDAAVAEDVATGLDLPTGLASDENYLYFRQADALYRAPVTGGTPEQLSPAVPAHPAQATQVFHVDSKYVYFAAGAGFGDSTLVRVAK
jgi:hypothetical protein